MLPEEMLTKLESALGPTGIVELRDMLESEEDDGLLELIQARADEVEEAEDAVDE